VAQIQSSVLIREPYTSFVAQRAYHQPPVQLLQEVAMSRSIFIFLSLVVCSLLAAILLPAQVQLQGRSQYGGLIRNVNTQKCIDVIGASTNKGANVQQYACNGGGNQRWFIGYTQ
jgi:hypothetical protein